jgi:anti-anti-sigma regulatory factor
MVSRKKASCAAPPLRLTGELTIFRAIELKQLIFSAPAPTEIDLAGVTEIDTAGLQLLLLAKRTALADKRELRLVAHSAAVTELFELLHVAAHFGDPMVVDAPARQSAGRP